MDTHALPQFGTVDALLDIPAVTVITVTDPTHVRSCVMALNLAAEHNSWEQSKAKYISRTGIIMFKKPHHQG